jgi:hypothetical protein
MRLAKQGGCRATGLFADAAAQLAEAPAPQAAVAKSECNAVKRFGKCFLPSPGGAGKGARRLPRKAELQLL